MRRAALALVLCLACTTEGPAPNNRPSGDAAVVQLAPPATDTASVVVPGLLEVERTQPEPEVDLASCLEGLRDGASLSQRGGADAAARAYQSARDLERRGAQQEARVAYFKLIEEHPQSPFVPYAYIAFAVMFQRDAGKDTAKLELARQAYLEVLKHKDPSAQRFALHELARIHAALGNQQEALASLLKVMQTGNDGVCAEALRGAASRELVKLYVDVGQPDRAFVFFRHAAGNDRLALSMTVDVAERYDRAHKTEEAQRALSSALSAGARSVRACTLASTLQDRPKTNASDELVTSAVICQRPP